MGIRYDDIGNRLKAFRLGSGLSAEEVARQAGISRTALYRSERGELVKLETLEKLADLLGVSITTLLGVGIEYIASAVSYFERMRQIEETAEHITIVAGPISFLLASPAFERTLDTTLRESVPEDLADRDRVFADIARIMEVLRERKATYRTRQPSIVNLMSALEIDRFVRNGMVGRYDLPEEVRRERHVPVKLVDLSGEPAAVELYAAPLVLVRPDGQVAWRGASMPEPGLLADCVRGAAPYAWKRTEELVAGG